jgi:hypothetical protein
VTDECTSQNPLPSGCELKAVRAAVLVGDNADDVSDTGACRRACSACQLCPRPRFFTLPFTWPAGPHVGRPPLSRFTPFISRKYKSKPLYKHLTCPAVHGDLQLLSIGILETDPSEARVARCDACVQRRRL